MKHILIATIAIFSSVTFADTFPNAQIDGVVLNPKNMHVIMRVRTASVCDQVALPQLIQDANNPTVFKVQAIAHKAAGVCISMIEKFSEVSLPALMEVSSVKLSKLANYTFEFEGTDQTLIVPGDHLMTSIQPEFQNE